MKKTFKFEDRVYQYQYTDLTALQAEYARELGEFKTHQKQGNPESFNQIVKSRGAEWLPMMMSYLVREMKDKKLMPFDIDKAETEVYEAFCQMPASEIPQMRAIVEDFFTKIGQTAVGSSLLAPRKNKLEINQLLPLMMHMNAHSKENAG